MAADNKVVVSGYDISGLLQALNALDGNVKEVVNGQPILTPFNIGGNTRVRLGKWLASVGETNKNLIETRNKLVKQFCAGAGPEGTNAAQVPPEKMAAFNDELKKMLEEPHEFPHAKVKAEDITAGDKNAIPISVLANLSPIFED